MSKRQVGVSSDDRSDSELLQASVEELKAFGELVRRHQDFVFGAAMRVTKDRGLAEEVAQEAFIRAYRAAGDFRGESQVRSWLYRISTNLALNAVTRRKEFATEHMPDLAVEIGPDRSVESASMGQELADAIAELPPKLREPLVLREIEHLSYQEIAQRTGAPLNTVRTRIMRARQALRDRMEGWR